MKVKFWTIRKRLNSTYVPPEDVQAIECSFKENCSDLRPTLILQGYSPSQNYFWIEILNRYYWVTDIVHLANDYVEVSGEVDPLSTYKNQILTKTVYVERAQNAFNRRIPDLTMLPKHGMHTKGTTVQFCPAPTDIAGEVPGQFILGVIGAGDQTPSGDCVSYYCLSFVSMNQLREYFYNASNYGDVLTDDVVKSFFNPFQYIVTAYYLPDTYLNQGATDSIKYGWFSSNDLKGHLIKSSVYGHQINTWNIAIPRPNENSSEFVNFSPYATYKLYIPFFGSYEIGGDALYPFNYIRLKMTLDIPTGKAFISMHGQSQPIEADGVILQRFEGQLGCPVQLAQTTIDILGAAAGAAQAIGSAASSMINPLAGAGGVFHGIANAANSLKPTMDSVSSNGARAYAKFNNFIDFQSQYIEVSSSDLSTEGRPLGEEKLLSELTGYVKCSDASVSISSAFREEEQMINDYLNGGVYIE